MSNFHKPRVYRSSDGCCICRAKSSSSRFTDCRRYESFLQKCFDLKNPRHGEICNACVLLVKRYKQLPEGSARHWGHVVDARASGPGVKNKRHREDVAAHLDDQPSTSFAAAAAAASHTNSRPYTAEKYPKIRRKPKKNKTTTNAPTATATNAKATTANARNTNAPNASTPSVSAPNSSATTASVVQTNEAQSPGTPESLDYNLIDKVISKIEVRPGGSLYAPVEPCRSRKSSIKRRLLNSPHKSSALTLERTSGPDLKINTCCSKIVLTKEEKVLFGMDMNVYKPCNEHKLDADEASANSAAPPLPTASIVQLASHPKPAIVVKPSTSGVNGNANGSVHANGNTNGNGSVHANGNGSVNANGNGSVNANGKGKGSVNGNTNGNGSVNGIANGSANANGYVNVNANGNSISTPTSVLKKHHLFYKRQAESFPQGDPVSATNTTTSTNTSSTSNSTHNPNKTELSTETLATNPLINISGKTPVSSVSPPTASLSSVAATASPHQLLPRHSAAKITTITAVPTNMHASSSSVSTLPNKSYSHDFLHKTRVADTSKIVKNSTKNNSTNALLNTVTRVRPADLLVSPAVQLTAATARQLSKANLMAHPVQTSSSVHLQPPLHAMPYPQAQQPSGSTSSAASSASQSPSGSTKFNDNSSDSGFEENVLDRKSASPLQEEQDRKIFEWSGNSPLMLNEKKTMHMPSGVILQGDVHNLIQASNEITEQMLFNRRRRQVDRVTSAAEAIAAAVKAQHEAARMVDKDSTSCVVSVKIAKCQNPPPKMRAIYNNNNNNNNNNSHNNHNAIQHENGITTIVPSSSLAASSQTAAMNALNAPSTVTITPAPTTAAATAGGAAATKQKNNLQYASNIIHHRNGTITNGSSNISSSLNQKVILVKSNAATGQPTSTRYYNRTISAAGVVIASTSAQAAKHFKKGV